jgi:hypothetical protein
MSTKTPRTKRPQAVAADEPVSATPQCAEDGRGVMIAEAAYYRAQQRGFGGGADAVLDDWLEAEAEVDRALGGAAMPERSARERTR